MNTAAANAGRTHGLHGPLSGRIEKNCRLIQLSTGELLKDLRRASRVKADMTAEVCRQRVWIDEISATNATCRQLLDVECRAHVQTRAMLDETVTRLNEQHDQLMIERAARQAAEDSLQLTRDDCRQLSDELDRTQRKFQLVDSLVDIALLEEDSEFQVDDRSRQITEVILDLENKMERKYEERLKTQDDKIRQLEAAAADVYEVE